MAGNGGFQASGGYNDRPPSSTGSGEPDVGVDPASSSFFNNEFKRHEDLKMMLDSNKDSQKLDAMKRIVGMVAKGKDASDLFPAVVKNVVCKNLEVKKLVYVYLTRYAEEQQDLALLSISTFQRALKDPNQLIRASALRVLSSIRVQMIAPIMMLSIKEAVMDMSPYVRKTAAHAIPKVYSIDPEQKDQLVEVIEKLLADKTTLVAGSAIQAFEEVCPERSDLIHKNYRKLCNLLVDVEEWGQVVIINMLTRYVRSQFINPNADNVGDEVDKPFYESEKDSNDDDDDDDDDKEEAKAKTKPKQYVMDSDHRLILRQCKPLLNSRNAAVVMAVAQLYHHCAPKSEVSTVARSLIRLLRSHSEVQYVVLSNIATMSLKQKGMFEPFLKSFYVRSNDATHIKLLKLEILTSLATETNIATILRELQTYVTSSDKEFAAATIQAIGRCASNISEVTDTCLNGLVLLMSNRDESVVAESVVVIKKLLQMQSSTHKDIIIHMARMVDNITVPMARASILWLIGEYSERVPKIAPDVLRKMAKTFIQEEDIVKLQILNLGAKLMITNSKQTKLLCQYVFNLAKYDQNYDIRDRSRFLRALVLPTGEKGQLAKHAKKIFLSTKPAPVLESKFKDRDQYQQLPEWPEVAPDPSVRNVEVVMPWSEKTPLTKKQKQKPEKSFYSSTESSSPEDSSDDEDSDDESEDEETDSDDEKSEDSEEDSESSDDTDIEKYKPKKEEKVEKKKEVVVAESESEEDSSEEEDSSDDESSTESEVEVKKKKSPVKKPPAKKAPKKPSQDLDLLLDFGDDVPSGGPVGGAGGGPTIGAGDLLTPLSALNIDNTSSATNTASASSQMFAPVQVQSKSRELLNKMAGDGLSVTYKFTRTISIFSPKMVSIELSFTNGSDKTLSGIKIGQKKIQSGMEIHDFPEIAALAPKNSTTVLMAINFNDTTQPAGFEICTEEKKFNVSISAPVGELLQPYNIHEKEFIKEQGKLSGMNENTAKVKIEEDKTDMKSVVTAVYRVANVVQVPSSEDGTYRFAAQTMASNIPVLTTVSVKDDGTGKLTVNCEKMVIGTMLMKDVKGSLES
ncbi:AP-3 complex subunit beta-2-like isoform X2 [Mercenaria mercenaria]|uniref:AP-3 complex subunit beta-2-like isoform X2 n=1 Tax=Mercenaria mercenaria TaxID=6596 RepID=UPI00234E6546|nr:AP-3 complex subunit beta-2-like isoform X2 [Mercenaria mercenaria]